jgi:DNA-binding NtrC family response regulator
MRTQSASERTPTTLASSRAGALTVLSVSPLEADHLSLQTIIGDSTWIVYKTHELVSALVLLQQHDIAVVLCERDLLPGSYIDVLEHISALPNAPSLIVVSRLADERLWAEALNLGAWDVLAKPFDRNELVRSVKSAWRHWRDQGELRANRATQKMAATGTSDLKLTAASVG